MEACHICRTAFRALRSTRLSTPLSRPLLRQQLPPRTHRQISTSSLPRVAQPSLWQSLIPKPFRKSPSDPSSPPAPKSKEWNPATIYIILALLAGSQAIQLMNLRRQMRNFSNQTEAKLSLLREVIQRVKDGEDVDVEGLLGTGDEDREREWEEVLDEIEREDSLYVRKRHRKSNGEEPVPVEEMEERGDTNIVEPPKKREEDGEAKGKAGAKFY